MACLDTIRRKANKLGGSTQLQSHPHASVMCWFRDKALAMEMSQYATDSGHVHTDIISGILYEHDGSGTAYRIAVYSEDFKQKADKKMSTRSTIAMQIPSGPNAGKFLYIYCHSDGYLSHNGAYLLAYYRQERLIRQILKLGDLYILGACLGGEEDPPDEALDPEVGDKPDVCEFFHRDRGESRESTKAAIACDLQDLSARAMNINAEYLYVFSGQETRDPCWYWSPVSYTADGVPDCFEDMELLTVKNMVDSLKAQEFGGFSVDHDVNRIQTICREVEVEPEPEPNTVTNIEDLMIDNEVVVKLDSGLSLRSGNTQDGSYASGEYVRLCDERGEEIIYWAYDEWENDPILVMGAIINAAARFRPAGFVINLNEEAGHGYNPSP
jgi:hypothetical protein